MSSFDKVVKLACKPKAAAPKAKYIDPIIAATWSDDGAIHDVCKALVPRLREPNVVVVFKALIVLHTMIRNGATDNVLAYLSSSDILRLKNISAANWEGYTAPQNLQAYALYLESRIKTYKDLKHDVIKVQADNNRDMRNSVNVEEDGYRGRKDRNAKSQTAPSRSKTIMGRKLRQMTVEKGLLRETKAVHKMIDMLVECRFYLDDLEDELIITALRMLVKDLLILFQAGNEGVINVLESYFEMSHIDAEEALHIYRHFCKQTEAVVEYLGVARKLQNLLNVPVPNLKHAPVSLAGALQEYLDDPNFEQNRIEYRANKEAAERGSKPSANGAKATPQATEPAPTTRARSASQPLPSGSKAAESSNTAASSSKPKGITDFFSAIEEEQPNMFNPQTNSPSTAYFHQQSAANPFAQMQMQMQTGQPAMVFPQHTALPQNAFGAPPANLLVPQQTGHRPFSSYLPTDFSVQPQATGFPTATPAFPQSLSPNNSLQPQQNFLRPQATGSNPFRQSMLVPQTTGMALFGVGNPQQQQQQQPLPFGTTGTVVANGNFAQTTLTFPQQTGQPGLTASASAGPSFTSFPQNTFNTNTNGNASSSTPFAAPQATPFGALGAAGQTNNVPMIQRPGSAPLTSKTTFSSSSPPPQMVKSHQTGSKNPFGPILTPAPPMPKAPTLFELSTGFGGMNLNSRNGNAAGSNGAQTEQQPQSQPQQATSAASNTFLFTNSSLNPGATDMSGVASSFAFNKPSGAGPSSTSTPNTTTANSSTFSSNAPPTLNSTITGSTSTFSDSVFSTFSNQPTGTTVTSTSTQPSSAFSPTGLSSSALKPQMTGFAGLKPFKPTSSFGASLMENLPPVPGSGATTPSVNTTGTTNGFNSSIPNSNTFAGQLGQISNRTTSPPPFNPSQQSATPASFPPASQLSFLSSPPPGAQQSTSQGLLSQRTGGGFTPSSQFGQTLGVGLRPQMTGGGAANPFRASMAAGSFTGGTGSPTAATHATGAFGGAAGQGAGGSPTPNHPAFNPSAFGSMGFGSTMGLSAFGGQQQQQQQPQQQGSLI